ncbi:phage holin family protein [Fictibacillus enclensis]|uniref:phage holin family protein n=1 Tax=Fictibacillus enclensis TaxID=1017270 RepID=UPI0025A022B4|nr:phage holin family protein [Fictibacillus enclensis]MDM5198457.1 phage holin family protein [Fictibacillus enclensis]
MSRVQMLFKSCSALAGAYAGYFFGPMSPLIIALVILAILDYLTGIIASAYEGKLSSSVGFKGILKKIAIFCIVAVAHSLDTLLGGHYIRDATIFFYLSNELLSIIENAGRTNIPLPPAIRKAFLVLKQKEEEKEKKTD